MQILSLLLWIIWISYRVVLIYDSYFCNFDIKANKSLILFNNHHKIQAVRYKYSNIWITWLKISIIKAFVFPMKQVAAEEEY